MRKRSKKASKRFRDEFGSGTADEANAAPYFVGAFDTVASLGAKGPLQVVLEVFVAALVLAIASVISAMLHWIAGLRWFEALLISVATVGLASYWYAVVWLNSSVTLVIRCSPRLATTVLLCPNGSVMTVVAVEPETVRE